ncbi:CD1375 family protein [Brevibacillus laterosporus]|uniref:CD1375 family protein n=1 Tax=Brevibacillus halotolerans TaxID=1507437 RepID=A0ABT4HR32_9BACL|nr:MULTISPECIES: CD1375 family protein [Brevibacillus]MCR8983523.1 CD1375 family protein [Brevibacillus laterosporus]MCZ0829241.1 CD1375 family protein [Brevibacillus halotolerans]
MTKQYMIPVYGLLVKAGRREIESLPEIYRVPVAEYLAEQAEM